MLRFIKPQTSKRRQLVGSKDTQLANAHVPCVVVYVGVWSCACVCVGVYVGVMSLPRPPRVYMGVRSPPRQTRRPASQLISASEASLERLRLSLARIQGGKGSQTTLPPAPRQVPTQVPTFRMQEETRERRKRQIGGSRSPLANALWDEVDAAFPLCTPTKARSGGVQERVEREEEEEEEQEGGEEVSALMDRTAVFDSPNSVVDRLEARLGKLRAAVDDPAVLEAEIDALQNEFGPAISALVRSQHELKTELAFARAQASAHPTSADDLDWCHAQLSHLSSDLDHIILEAQLPSDDVVGSDE